MELRNQDSFNGSIDSGKTKTLEFPQCQPAEAAQVMIDNGTTGVTSPDPRATPWTVYGGPPLSPSEAIYVSLERVRFWKETVVTDI